MRSRFIVLGLLISLACNASYYDIFHKGDKIVLRDKYSGEILVKSSEAGEVFAHCLDLLKEENGGKLDVGPGDFLIDRPLKVGDNVSITGQGRFSRLVFKGPFEIGLSIKDGLDVELSDILIVCRDQSVSSGIIVDNSGSCVIKDAKIVGFEKYGIVFKNRTFLSKIEGCELAGNEVSNIYFTKLDSSGRLGDYIPNTISNCIIVGGGKGIELDNAFLTNIISNSFTQCLDHAIHIHTESNAILVNGNHTFQIDGHSLFIEDYAYEMSISGNMFSWQSGSALVVRKSCWGSISGNVFIDSGFSPDVDNFTTHFKDYEGQYQLRDAVVLDDVTGYTVNGNTIYNWQVCPQLRNGILEDSLSYKNIISNNTINYFKNKAVDSMGKNTIVRDNSSEGDVPYHWLPSKIKKENVTFDLKPGQHHIQSWLRKSAKEYAEKY